MRVGVLLPVTTPAKVGMHPVPIPAVNWPRNDGHQWNDRQEEEAQQEERHTVDHRKEKERKRMRQWTPDKEEHRDGNTEYRRKEGTERDPHHERKHTTKHMDDPRHTHRDPTWPRRPRTDRTTQQDHDQQGQPHTVDMDHTRKWTDKGPEWPAGRKTEDRKRRVAAMDETTDPTITNNDQMEDHRRPAADPTTAPGQSTQRWTDRDQAQWNRTNTSTTPDCTGAQT
ncbi:hypothetical protein quinque_006077 [Culex quinquefasciatus]